MVMVPAEPGKASTAQDCTVLMKRDGGELAREGGGGEEKTGILDH